MVGNRSISVSGSCELERGAICRQLWWEVTYSLFLRFQAAILAYYVVEVYDLVRSEANLWRVPFYRRFPVKVASSPLCAANPPGLVRVVFRAVSPGCFSGCVAKLFFGLCRQVVFWLCRQVIFLAVSLGCFSGCVARFVTDYVVGWFLAGFARVRILTFVSVVIAQDRAS